jgi:23S rRNA (guanosine2251-2'-O)-methyltransferase
MVELAAWAPPPGPATVLLLDGVTNPSNVGMLIRTAVAAGLAGVVLPRTGVPDVGPLVVKASAGVAYRATLLRSATALEAVEVLDRLGWVTVGLRASDAPSLYAGDLPARAAFVLGNETDGVSDAVAGRLAEWRSIPLANGVESLNVASAGAVVAFEVARRQLEGPTER